MDLLRTLKVIHGRCSKEMLGFFSGMYLCFWPPKAFDFLFAPQPQHVRPQGSTHKEVTR